MQSPDGTVSWGKISYREIIAPEHLVFVVSFSDEREGVTRYKMIETWPLEVLNMIAFSERTGRTTVRLTAGPINATEAEQKTFRDGFEGMDQGWSQSLDRLAVDLLGLMKGREK